MIEKGIGTGTGGGQTLSLGSTELGIEFLRDFKNFGVIAPRITSYNVILLI